MIWLTWRQHRLQLLYAAITLAVVAVVLIPTGLRIHSAYADSGLASCLRGLGTAELADAGATIDCDSAAEEFGKTDFGYVVPEVLLVVLPLLAGLFVGASLVASEVERGTHRLVWTQGVSRLRWLLVKLGLTGLGAALLAAAFALLTSWWIGPLTHADQFHGSKFAFPYFDLGGIAPIGHTMFALSLGLAAGAITRRVLPAMAITIAGFAVVRAMVTAFVRPRLLSPLERRFAIGSEEVPNRAQGDWILSYGIYEKDGTTPVAKDTIAICHPDEAAMCGGPDRLNVWTYQPGDRFWLFQFLETGIYLLLAAALIAVAVHVVTRRIS